MFCCFVLPWLPSKRKLFAMFHPFMIFINSSSYCTLQHYLWAIPRQKHEKACTKYTGSLLKYLSTNRLSGWFAVFAPKFSTLFSFLHFLLISMLIIFVKNTEKDGTGVGGGGGKMSHLLKISSPDICFVVSSFHDFHLRESCLRCFTLLGFS